MTCRFACRVYVVCRLNVDNLSSFSRNKVVFDGVVAQLVEHHNGIVGVVSSNLIGSTRGTRVFLILMCRSGEIGRHA